MAKKYVPVTTAAECEAYNKAGVLYWRRNGSNFWKYNSDTKYNWKSELKMFNPSILVDTDED